MTRCPRADELAAHLRHVLDPVAERVVAAHVGSCERCQLRTLLLKEPAMPGRPDDIRKDAEPTEGHLEPEDIYGLMESSLSAKRSKEVREHLDRCPECVRQVAHVLAAEAPPSPEEEAALSRLGDTSASELLDRLRSRIVATSPASHRRASITWAMLLAAAASVVGVALLSWWAYAYVISPLRSRNLVAQATTDLIALRQGTGRLPLRYIPSFQRGRVTRSGFDIEDPEEQALETSIESRLRHAVELTPRDARARTALGLFLLDAGRLDEAETTLREALERDPSSVQALNGLSVIDFDRARRLPSQAEALRQEGIELLRRALTIDEHNLMVLYNMAVYYQESGSPQTARRAWLAYTSQDGTSEWAAVAQENLRLLGFR